MSALQIVHYCEALFYLRKLRGMRYETDRVAALLDLELLEEEKAWKDRTSTPSHTNKP